MSEVRFVEIADRVWVARSPWFDVNVTAIGGTGGLVVVDTHASSDAAGEVLEGLRALGVGPVTGVVNTHEHFDHCLGNAAFRAAHRDVPIHAHEVAAQQTAPAAARAKAAYEADPNDPHRAEVLSTEVVVADRTFSSAMALDLGDRLVELVHPGRGHTGGDAVVRVPDADVLLTGDLVEESTLHGGVPGFGPDCYPLEWPTTLDLVLGLMSDATTAVPGHGAPVGRGFVEDQRDAIGVVAETIRDLAARGVGPDQALGSASWPYPVDQLGDAVARGFAQLPRGARRLPLA